ncbi:MAG: Wzz/FepE/Etk N-terminal domain-containing protein [Gaiellales bacterium]
MTEFFRRIWRHKVIALIVAVVVINAGNAYALTQGKRYQSNATVSLFPSTPQTGAYDKFAANTLATYAQLVKSSTFLSTVGKGLTPPLSGGALRSKVSVQPVPNTTVLIVTGTGSNARLAAAIASGVANQLVVDIQQHNSGVYQPSITDQARIPVNPSSPSSVLVIGASVVAGLILAAAAALLWDRLFVRVRDPRMLSEVSGLGVLGVAPASKALRTGARPGSGDPQLARFEESLRSVRTNLLLSHRAGLRSVAVMGIGGGPDAATVAAGLAAVMTEMEPRVLLIDGDLVQPALHETFDLPNDVGLTSVSRDMNDLGSVARETNVPGLRVVTSGPPPESRRQEVELYHRQIARFRDLAGIVIVSSRPLMAGSDARVLAAAVDGVVLVVRAGTLSPDQVRDAVESLRMLGVRVFGTVLTEAPPDMALRWRSGYQVHVASPAADGEVGRAAASPGAAFGRSG